MIQPVDMPATASNSTSNKDPLSKSAMIGRAFAVAFFESQNAELPKIVELSPAHLFLHAHAAPVRALVARRRRLPPAIGRRHRRRRPRPHLQ
jgi:hypothetical protein